MPPGLEIEPDLVAVDRLDPGHVAKQDTELRMPLLDQRPISEGDVVGRDRRAVVEPGPGPEPEGDPAARVRELDRLGDEAVERIRLVEGAGHQRVEHKRVPRLLPALEDEGVEGLERIESPELQRPALGRVRIDVIEMAEIRAVFEVAEDGDAMADLDRAGKRLAREQRQNRRAGIAEKARPHCPPPSLRLRSSRLAALPASTHQLIRSLPYFGLFSGLPNLSQ